MRRIWWAFALALIAAPVAASAQLQQPRCGGWPPLREREGMIIGQAGTTCYGQVFTQFPPNVSLLDVRVKEPPRRGSFRMIGSRDFAYTADRSGTGLDQLVIETDWMRGGKRFTKDFVIKAASDDEYLKAGGTAGKPPEGVDVNRIRRRK